MKRLIVLAALTLLGGCGEEKAAQEAVLKALNDPDSAKFGEFYYNPATGKGCIGVNAKNAMGGYTGEKQVELVKATDGWAAVGDMEFSHEDCKWLHADKVEGAE